MRFLLRVSIGTAGLLFLFICTPATHAETETWTNEKPTASRRVLVTGDSITQGSSGDYTWRYRIWKKLNQTEPDSVSFVGNNGGVYDNVNGALGSPYYAVSFTGKWHASRWGTTLVDELPKIADQVANSNANVLIEMLGSNDLTFLSDAAGTEVKLRNYINSARSGNPGIDIVLCQVLNKYDFFGSKYLLSSKANDFATRLDQIAAQMSTPASRIVVAETLSGWDPKLHTWDGTHPNSTGETLIAQRVSGALAQLGIGTSTPNVFQETAWGVKLQAPRLQSATRERRCPGIERAPAPREC